jgi:hypothetical protein
VLELTAEGYGALTAADGGEHGASARPRRLILEVPAGIGEGLNLMLLTAVTVFGSIALDEYESGITCPRVLHDLGQISGGARVELTYCAEGKPGFKYRLI